MSVLGLTMSGSVVEPWKVCSGYKLTPRTAHPSRHVTVHEHERRAETRRLSTDPLAGALMTVLSICRLQGQPSWETVMFAPAMLMEALRPATDSLGCGSTVTVTEDDPMPDDCEKWTHEAEE
jgi:hypothetical protein